MPKKGLIVLSQAKANAEQRNHEPNILALSQVFKSLHKRVEMYLKLIDTIVTTGHASFLLEKKKTAQMNEIAEKETVIYELLNMKRRTFGVVSATLGIQSPPPVTLVSPVPVTMVVVTFQSEKCYYHVLFHSEKRHLFFKMSFLSVPTNICCCYHSICSK
jgi:hypothetical protein